ncbi:MAG: hypothetical protein SGI77_24365 [Pirellulaceae bacterium]|nr:hypothetical protein [Pirellulaceae bacterium]
MNKRNWRCDCWFFIVLALFGFRLNTLDAQTQRSERIRELFVPFEDLDAILGSDVKRVFMTRDEFEKLKLAAVAQPKAKLPLEIGLLSANYDAMMSDGRALMTGKLVIEVLSEGLHPLPLTFADVGIRSATLDGKPARLAMNEAKQIVLFVEGIGLHAFELLMVMPVSSNAAQQTLHFHVPNAPAGQVTFQVPGNVEVQSGASVLSREVDPKSATTKFQVVPPNGPVSIVMSLNNRQKREQNTVMARGVLVDELTSAYERLHVNMTMEVLNGATDEFRFIVDEDLEVNSVASDLLSRWEVITTGKEKVLVVKMRTPITERVDITARLDRKNLTLENWELPQFRPVGVEGFTAFVEWVTEERLEVSEVKAEGMMPISSQSLGAVRFENLQSKESSGPRVQTTATFYAISADHRLTARLRLPPPELATIANSLIAVSDSGIEVTGGFSLSPEIDKLFEFSFLAPKNWDIESIRSSDAGELKFQRFEDKLGTRIRVLIPQGVVPGTQQSVIFQARHVPPAWLDNWTTQTIELPAFPAVGAIAQSGAMALQLKDDLVAIPDVTQNLIALNESEKEKYRLGGIPTALAYRYNSTDWSAKIGVSRTSPRLVARAMSFFRVEQESIRVHQELIYLIDQARSKQLSFSLPEETPSEISIQGLDGIQIKESTSRVANGRRLWVVDLAERHAGKVRLSVDFTQNVNDSERTGIVLPVVRAELVDYQSGTMAIEGHPEFDTRVVKKPRSIDIGELVDAEYQAGSRLLGAFGYAGTQDELSIDLTRRTIYGLPTTIVERAEIVTSLSATGVGQTAARYRLRTKASYLELQLPEEATLWSVFLDGNPALPQRIDSRVWISMPASATATVRDLQVVYTIPTESMSLMCNVDVDAPVLFERKDRDSKGEIIPVAGLDWQLIMPSGYRVVSSDGISATPAFESILSRLLGTLWRLGGGSNTNFLTVTNARESARRSPSMLGGTGLDFEASSNQPMEEKSGQATRELSALAADSSSNVSPSKTPASALELPSTTSTPAENSLMQTRIDQEGVKMAQQGPAKNRSNLWAMEGVRSLAIELSNTSQSNSTFALTTLGTQTRTRLTIVDATKLNWLSWVIGLVVFAIGLRINSRSNRIYYLAIVTIAAVLLPIVTGSHFEFESIQIATFSAALALVAYYLMQQLCCGCSRVLQRRKVHQPVLDKSIVATSAMLIAIGLAMMLSSGSTLAQTTTDEKLQSSNQTVPATVGKVVTNFQELENLLITLSHSGTASIPENAVVVPYDPNSKVESTPSQKLMVPYATYERLWNLAYPNKLLEAVKPPTEFAWAGAEYTTTLDGSASMTMTGKIRIEQYVERELAIPVPIAGCVLESAFVDGKPAKLQHIASNAKQAKPEQSASRQAEHHNLFVLYSSGKGTKEIRLTLRWQVAKSGGWRVVDGQIPVGPASTLEIAVVRENTEIRLSKVTDRAVYMTSRANETIKTAMGTDGRLAMQWRDKISEAVVDQGLTVESRAVLDVQTDSLRMIWQADFQFLRGRRESFSLRVPKGYLIEKVVGENVRSWSTKMLESTQQLDIELLKAAVDRESLTVLIAKQSELQIVPLPNAKQEHVDASHFLVPEILVPDAMLHQGRLTVRRSSILDVRAGDISGLSRMDPPDESRLVQQLGSASPFETTTYQAYHFSQPGFQLSISAVVFSQKTSVALQSLIKISQLETTLETRLLFNATQRPIHHVRVRIPQGMKIDAPQVPGKHEWSVVNSSDDQDRNSKLIEIFLVDGQLGEFPIILRGTLDVGGGDVVTPASIELPRLQVLDVDNQRGEMVVQADPAYNVTTRALQECEVKLLNTVSDWLSPNQRRLARTVVAYSNPGYSGQIVLSPQTPRVSSLAVTNVKITDRAIEETIYIEATIVSAGITEFVFQLPAVLKNARIRAPFIRQKSVTPINSDADSPVQVVIKLQDSIMGQFAIFIEHDRLHNAGLQIAPFPVIETGTTSMRLITLENVSRDELITGDLVSIAPLDAAELQKQRRVRDLGGKSAIVYKINENQIGAGFPRLTFETKGRSTVETSSARIGLSQTLLVVDDLGAYRAIQEYRVENRTEPFLEVEIPNESRLWTVHVAGEPVKPTSVAGSSNLVRIPLIKTAEGDLDYAVVLKYGGSLPRTGRMRKTDFPLMKTRNIHVELSQVRLRLPENFRWFNFEGSLGLVKNESEIQAGWLSFRTRQIVELTELLSSSSDMYSRVRARSNLDQLEAAVGIQNSAYFDTQAAKPSDELQRQINQNAFALGLAKQQVVELQKSVPSKDKAIDNRELLGELFETQVNGRSYNVVDGLGLNFTTKDSPVGGTVVKQIEPGKALTIPDLKKLDEFEARKEADAKLGIQRDGLGDTREQAEKYSQRLQAQNFGGIAANGLTMNNSAVNNSGMTLQNATPRGSAGASITRYAADDLGQTMSGFNRGLQSDPFSAAIQQETSKTQISQPQTTIPLPSQPPVDSDLRRRRDVEQKSMEGFDQNGLFKRNAFMASLDVDIPVRGQEFLFTTPGGELELAARSLSHHMIGRFSMAVCLVIAAGFAYVLLKWLHSMLDHQTGRQVLAATLLVLGLVSLGFGLLPIYGSLSLLASLALFFTMLPSVEASVP